VLAKARERVRVGGATAPPGRTAGRAAEVDPARDPHLLLQSVTGGASDIVWVEASGARTREHDAAGRPAPLSGQPGGSTDKMQILDETVKTLVTDRLRKIEEQLEGDVAFFYGDITEAVIRVFRDFMERMAARPAMKNRLIFFLNTPGGSAEAAEKMVEIIRHHFDEVFFVVPDFAYSAGTILCMSGDRIYMDYSSSLGPIDPQVWNGKEWVPALGYLDKVEGLLQKAVAGQLTNAEFLILQNQDLALLSRYEQARDLTVTLLKKWLVEYKFRDWTKHATDPTKKGNPVTSEEKQERAEQIARMLGDNKRWHSHNRMIGPDTLTQELKLQINDYSGDDVLRPLVRSYNDLLTDYIARNGWVFFMHNRDFF
jgi:hypothetical protein